MTRFWDGRTDGRTDGRSDCTPRPAFAFGDAGKKQISSLNQKSLPINLTKDIKQRFKTKKKPKTKRYAETTLKPDFFNFIIQNIAIHGTND